MKPFDWQRRCAVRHEHQTKLVSLFRIGWWPTGLDQKFPIWLEVKLDRTVPRVFPPTPTRIYAQNTILGKHRKESVMVVPPNIQKILGNYKTCYRWSNSVFSV